MAIRSRGAEQTNLMGGDNYTIEIEYNPYIYELSVIKTSIGEDNLKICEVAKNNRGKALHSWYSTMIESIAEDFDSKKFNIIFSGREEDFLDIEEYVDGLDENYEIQININEKKGKEDIINQIEGFIKEIKVEGPQKLNKNFEEKKVDDEFKRAKNTEAEICIIATMSSGKSTLINAILGEEILPSENQACTATICKIKDKKTLNKYRLKVKDQEEKKESEWEDASLENIKKYNSDGNEKALSIEIEGPIEGINSNEMNLVLIDTPGTNNSQNGNHRELTYKLIKDTTNNPLVLYVLNTTQLGVNDDSVLLQEISEIIRENGKQAEERFIFALNKIDAYDPDKDPIENAIQNCKKYLKKHGIDNPKIFPISAIAAKLVRDKSRGKSLSRTEQSDLSTFEVKFLPSEEDNYLGINTIKYASIPEKIKKYLYKEEDNTKLLLNYTGIIAIEKYIEKYLNKYAKTQKVKDSIKSLKNIIDTAYTETIMTKNKTEIELEKLSEDIKKVQDRLKNSGPERIKELKEQIKKIKPDNSKYKKLLEDSKNKITELKSEFSDSKATEVKAMKLVEEGKIKIEKIQANVKIELEKIAENQVKEKCGKIEEDFHSTYKKELEDLGLNSSFNLDLVISNEMIELEIGNMSSLIINASYEEEERTSRIVGYEKTYEWYEFWKSDYWKDTREAIYEDSYEKRKYVDLYKIYEEKFEPLTKIIEEKINENYEGLEESIEEIKKLTGEKIGEIELVISKKLNELQENINIKNKTEEDIKKYREIEKMIEKRRKELYDILSMFSV